MSKAFLACSRCHEVVMKSVTDHQQKIRTKVLVINGDEISAVCKGCGTEIPVPLKLDIELAKSLATRGEPRLYLKEQKI